MLRPASRVSFFRRAMLPALFLLLCLVPVVFAQTSDAQVRRGERHRFRHQIMQIEQQWRIALLRQDTIALGKLLNPEYLGISANGALETKEDILAQITTGALRITQLTLSDQKVRIFRQTAVVTSVAELRGTDRQILLDGRYRYTHVYVRDSSGKWTIASFEASKVDSSRE